MSKLCRLFLPALVISFISLSLPATAQQPETRTGIFRGMRVTYQWIPGTATGGQGKAVYQGDIILDHVQELPQSPAQESISIAYSQYMWPKVGSVYQIPYTIDPSSGNLTNLNTAISQFNSTFSGLIQLVSYTNQTDYVNFNFNPNDFSGVCEAYEGRIGGEQTVGGSASCTVATIPA